MSFLSGFNSGRAKNSVVGGIKSTVDYNNDGRRSFGEWARFGLGALASPTFTAARVGYNALQGRTPWASPYQRQDFGLSQPQSPLAQQQPQDFLNQFSAGQMGNTGLGQQAQPQAPQNTFLSGPRPTPTQMPVRNGLDFMDTQGSAYQSRNAPLYQPSAMQSNGGYFDMGKAGMVGGHWVGDAGWRTDANKAFGQTAEDMNFNAQMARQLATKGQ
jgi:hypothetical protein